MQILVLERTTSKDLNVTSSFSRDTHLKKILAEIVGCNACFNSSDVM
jgi:hypothetical protein